VECGIAQLCELSRIRLTSGLGFGHNSREQKWKYPCDRGIIPRIEKRTEGSFPEEMGRNNETGMGFCRDEALTCCII
jgi:hypothetical protein